VKRFRKGLVFKAHRLVCHSTLGWRVINKKKVEDLEGGADRPNPSHHGPLHGILIFGLGAIFSNANGSKNGPRRPLPAALFGF